MKKIYLSLAAIAGCLLIQAGAFSQTVTFTGGVSSNWNNPGNWDSNDVPNGNHTGATIIIPSGKSVVLSSFTATLTNVTIKIAANAALTLGGGGNGGGNAGILTLNGTSAVSLESDGVNPAFIQSSATTNINDKITIGGVTKFQGGTDYTATNTGSGVGKVTGPARATVNTGSGAQGFLAGSLPVVLVGFSANLASNDKVSVKWSTQQEISTDHFDIQRSSDGISWQTIATVKASGFSSLPKNYSIEDAAPLTGTNLYRLRMFDVDARFGLSSVVNVHLNALGKISVFPNPSVSLLTISLGRAPLTDWSLSLVNINGQLITTRKFSKDQTTVSLPVGLYPNGNYTVEITDGISRQSSKLLISHQ